MNIFKINPSFSERVWGGQKLNSMGYNIPKDKKIGEAWVISAHENGMGFAAEGIWKGKSVKEIFESNRTLFGNVQGSFPLLVKILTPEQNLSVQVHPNDELAKKHNDFGKPESWYVLDCPDNAKLIYGHTAKTKKELAEMIEKDQWKELLVEVPVKKGDFLYVPPGKIHAVTPNVVVYELQRSSDITYRVYDYGRLENGKPRKLHIEDTIVSTTVPDTNIAIINNATKLIHSNEYFSLYLYETSKETKPFKLIEKTGWLQITVIEGTGKINGVDYILGDCSIACDLNESSSLDITGNLKVLISWIKL
ncbi:mannose-6-phosphate isomerase [Spiroplasma sp. TIUS-1]|uniref:type I phosphomannose isomerase catalytic subunit n=1 Tax=Spiroplasma sp. TIUS-1 TaxID=216963 RepID=UPI0013991E5F|nr:type I phosphomannose isomerase catalytic subunit [Spiroplasma sp. TIUS-1]QHX35707.1 mannose-6-phosphate isomerase [Spiroplasma sp. TIUS-1]